MFRNLRNVLLCMQRRRGHGSCLPRQTRGWKLSKIAEYWELFLCINFSVVCWILSQPFYQAGREHCIWAFNSLISSHLIISELNWPTDPVCSRHSDQNGMHNVNASKLPAHSHCAVYLPVYRRSSDRKAEPKRSWLIAVVYHLTSCKFRISGKIPFLQW